MTKRLALLCAIPVILLVGACTTTPGGGNLAPTAVASATPSNGTAPHTVAFSAAGSTDSDGTIASYAWDFGDPASGAANTATGPTASHTYASTGNFVARLTVTDNKGATGTVTKVIGVIAGNQAPVAVATHTAPQSGPAPLTVQFSSDDSTDPDGIIVDYAWDFGTDPSSGSSQPDATHTYTVAGTYTATLTVTDDGGATNTTPVTITVGPNQAPTALGTATPDNGVAPLTVAFDGTASSDPEALALTYAWDFGDPTSGAANTATGATPTHVYSTVGPYTATLTVTDVGGLTDVTTVPVSVVAANLPPVADASTSAPASGKTPLTVAFSSAGSDDPDGIVTTIAWDFGDPSSGAANTATGASASHTYAAAGSYMATLTVTDDDGAIDTATFGVTVADNQAPTAIANPSTNSGTAPLGVALTSDSTDSDGTIASASWDFGDGTPVATGDSVAHTYSLPGSYTATLTVTDNDGATDTATVSTTVDAVAAARFVAMTGTDSGACDTPATACATVQYTVDQATAGDTVYVGPGTYAERVGLAKDVTIVGANAGVAGSAARGPESTIKGVTNAFVGSITDATSTTYSGNITGATSTSTIAGITGAGAISNASGSGVITDVTGTGVSPIVITTATAHELSTGNTISTSAIGGNPAANVTNKAITVIDATHFSLDGTTGTGNYTSGGTYKSGPVILTTSAPHSLNVGATYSSVAIAGLLGNTAANGTRSVTVLDANRLQVVGVVANAPYTSGGTYANTLAVITTTAPHNMVNGAKVNITGVVGTTNVNGSGKTVTVLDATRFTVVSNANAAYVSGGLVTAQSVVVTTDAPHGIPTNAAVTISGVAGTTSVNGTKTVTALDPTHLMLAGTVPNGDYTGGGTWTSTPVVITTAAPHGLTGGRIMIQDVVGIPAANGTYSTTLVDATHLLLNGVQGNGAYVSGGHYGSMSGTIVNGATNASPIVLSTTGPHGLATGSTVTVAGVLGNTAANGSWTVTAVDATHVSLNGSTGNANYTSGGGITPAQLSVTLDGIRLDPQGDASLVATTTVPVPLVQLYGGPSEIVRNSVFSGGAYVSGCSYTCTTMADYAFSVSVGGVTFERNLVQNFRRPLGIGQAATAGVPPTNATVADNVFTGVTSRAISLGATTGASLAGVTVTGNVVDATGITSPSSPAGMTITNGGNTISGNTFIGLSSGIYLDQCKKYSQANNHITGNTFTANGLGVYITVDPDGGQCTTSATEGTGGWVMGGGRITGLQITGNNFEGQTGPAVYYAGSWGANVPAESTGPIDVTCNWWGSAAAPGTGANGLSINGSSLVFTSTPYRTAPAPGGACDGV